MSARVPVAEEIRPRVFLNSLPKAGAHLAVKALELMGLSRGSRSIGTSTLYGSRSLLKHLLRGWGWSSDLVVIGVELPTPVRASWLRRRFDHIGPGQYCRGHVRHSEGFVHLLAEHGLSCLHVVRDPRDAVVSHAHYVTSHRRNPLHGHYRELEDWNRRLAFSITGGAVPGVGYLPSIGERCLSMDGWRSEPGVLTVRFEDLVGEPGGGEACRQRQALLSVCQFLDLPDPAERIERVVSGLFGGTSTFRNGRIGSWQTAFSPMHEELFHSTTSDLLIRWGYAAD